MSRLSGVIIATLAVLGLVALAPVAAFAHSGGGSAGGHFGGGGGGGAHFAGGGGSAHFAGAHVGGAQFVGGGRPMGGAHFGGAQFATGAGRFAAGGHFGGWHGPGHVFFRHFAGVYGPNVAIYPDYADAPDYSDTPDDYDAGANDQPTCVWARRLVPTYYGLRWRLVPVCYGY
jgi:hypothetical protein